MRYPILPSDSTEDIVWKTIDPEDIWVLDKLILSRKLGYCCGPAGMSVPQRANYIVRPCVNLFGMGVGASKQFLNEDTNHLPSGTFWCEWFSGDHLSVDYYMGQQILAVKGYHDNEHFGQWRKWQKVDVYIDFPDILYEVGKKYPFINVEYIDGKIIEVHLRSNPDWSFAEDIEEVIPVWNNTTVNVPSGYEFIASNDMNGRIGVYIKKFDK